MAWYSAISRGVSKFFDYNTSKTVYIKDKRIGITKRFIQIGVFVGYVIIYNLILQKGYQTTSRVVSVSLTKLKGVTFTEMKDYYQDITNRTWDVTDLVVPPEESDAIFVTTNIIITPHQVKSKCDEDFELDEAVCESDADCEADTPIVNAHGIRTGMCIPSSRNVSIKVCEIDGWCPVEINKPPLKPVLNGTKDFTVLVKNWITFPKFDVNWKNIIDEVDDKKYLQNCRYNENHSLDKFCPVFGLKTIAESAGQDFDDISVLGAVIAMDIDWDCNLDYNIKGCSPQYRFYRLDDKKANIAKGWNFRYANYYREGGVLYRDLIKVYGLRLVIKVTGKAGKFHIVPFMLIFGSGAGLLTLVTWLWHKAVMTCICPQYEPSTEEHVSQDVAEGQGHDAIEIAAPSVRPSHVGAAPSGLQNEASPSGPRPEASNFI